MIIDLINSGIEKYEYTIEGREIETLIVYSPGRKEKDSIKKLYEKEGYSEQVKQLILNDELEILTININHLDGIVVVFRSITSHYNVYYCLDQIKGFIVTDHMVNMLSYIEPDRREIDIEGVMDSYIYQFNYGVNTPVKGIFRMGAGDRLFYQSGKMDIDTIQKLMIYKYDYTRENGIRVLDKELSEALDRMVHNNTINTLSGGGRFRINSDVFGE